jgi:hypothetical protein
MTYLQSSSVPWASLLDKLKLRILANIILKLNSTKIIEK